MTKTVPSWFQTELKFLLSNPTCFVVLGKPGAGKTAVARKISQNWHCELVSRKCPWLCCLFSLVTDDEVYGSISRGTCTPFT